MKKNLILSGIALLALLASCGKPGDPSVNPGNDGPKEQPSGNVPTVTLTADASFDQAFLAKATLTLSEVSASDINVKLGNATVQDGKSRVPADYSKSVTIPAGEKSLQIDLEADVMGLKEGDYQFALKINSAEGATVGDPSVAYINLSYVFLPEVNLYSDSQFASTCKATLTATIAKAHDKDIIVRLELDPASQAQVSFAKEVTIPAGETSADTEVTVTVPAGLAAGTYPVIIGIASVENGRVGVSPKATINLNYPFSALVTIDGEFDDWKDALEWATPSGADYQGIRTLKLAGTPKKLYIYFEIVEPSPDDFDMFPMPIDIFLDSDGNYDTGGKLGSIDNDHQVPPYVDSGLSWYIEVANVHLGKDDYIDFTSGAYKYNGKDKDGIFSKLENQTGNYTSNEIFGTGTLGEDGIGRIEVQLDRTYFEIVGEQARVGIKLMNGNNNWSCYGLTPVGSGSNKVDMALINLPAYEAN
ncbi:MAG: hypothetical protein IJ652_03930 [Bacteroidales bacterium]|nr:hypothetical protein [Bacteroidales bacterium]